MNQNQLRLTMTVWEKDRGKSGNILMKGQPGIIIEVERKRTRNQPGRYQIPPDSEDRRKPHSKGGRSIGYSQM